MTSLKRTTRRFASNEGNCFLYGCGILAVCTIIAVIVTVFGARYYMGQLQEKYTEDQPVNLPVIDLSEEEIEILLTRVDSFYEQLQDGTATEPLILDQNDLNSIIQFHPEFTTLSDKVYFTLDGDKVSGQVSVSLGDIPMFGGRYFNGTADFDVSFENGIGKVFVLDATVKGESIPETYIAEARKENLASNMQQDPETQEVMNKIETIEIIDSKIIVTPKDLSQTDL
ncbi:MAG: hypothetical protein COA73_08070 [Candidatus Hydrogenedentota bacterium]|nr:MAG: hypothetical protein COA73_08070 [Candidatus Hydrogenedentota bacterium]